MPDLSILLVVLVAAAMLVFAVIAFATGRLRWRITTGAIAGGVIVVGVSIDRALGHGVAAGIAITAGLLGLSALAFHFALRELGALDPPPRPGVLESDPNILSIDLSDRDDH